MMMGLSDEAAITDDIPAHGDSVAIKSETGHRLSTLVKGKGITVTREATREPINTAPTDSGEPLPDQVRAKMEALLGMDFSAVRIHVGPQARRMGARAYTRGMDIFFAPGLYQPWTSSGQELLAHELTHVVQQVQGRVDATKNINGIVLSDDAALEREADEMGRKTTYGAATVSTSFDSHRSVPAQTLRSPILGPLNPERGTDVPIQRDVDYDALAQTLYEEEQEITYDIEDVIAVLEQLPLGGFPQLLRAYALKSRMPLVMVWKNRLYQDEYRQVMERVTGIRVAYSADAVAARTTESGYFLRAEHSISAEMVQDGKDAMISITALMRSYYGIQSAGEQAFAPKRAYALEQFFAAHGLTSSGETMITTANRAILSEQISKFAVVWLQFRAGHPWPSYDESALEGICNTMADKFLSYIERLNGQYREVNECRSPEQ